MKSVCQSFWLLTVAAGNLVVIIITELDPVSWITTEHRMTANFVLWAAVLSIATFLFHRQAINYPYREEMESVPLGE